MHLHFTIRQKGVLHLKCLFIGGGDWGLFSFSFMYFLYGLRVIKILCIFCICWGVIIFCLYFPYVLGWAGILFPDHMSGTCHIHHLTILSQDIHFLLSGSRKREMQKNCLRITMIKISFTCKKSSVPSYTCH